MLNIFLLIMGFACKRANQSAYSNENSNKSELVVKITDSLPVSYNELQKVRMPFFKVFKGRVDDKNLTVYLVKSDEPFPYYDGFYYFDDGNIVRKINGYESVSVIDSTSQIGISPSTGMVTAIKMEKQWKSKKIIESFMSLSDNFTSVPFAEESYDLNKFGFLGWYTNNAFKGYFSYPYFKTKKNKPQFNDDNLDIENSNSVDLKEIETPFEYIGKEVKFKVNDASDSLKSVASLTLPKVDFDLKNKIYQEIFLNKDNSFSEIEDILRKDAVLNLETNSNIVHDFKQNHDTKNNYLLTEHSLRVNYYDNNIISFEYRNKQLCSKSRNSSFNIRFLNYDILGNRFLRVEDVFKESSLEKIEKIIEKSTDMKNFKKNEGLSEGLGRFNISNFFLYRKGVIFRYPPTKNYFQDIYILIPYSDLNSCLTESFKNKIKNWN